MKLCSFLAVSLFFSLTQAKPLSIYRAHGQATVLANPSLETMAMQANFSVNGFGLSAESGFNIGGPSKSIGYTEWAVHLRFLTWLDHRLARSVDPHLDVGVVFEGPGGEETATFVGVGLDLAWATRTEDIHPVFTIQYRYLTPNSLPEQTVLLGLGIRLSN